ncbi:MAG TPA: sigma 54-interacting transcriptional regulator [Thermoanaerobaculia bacterium]|jgi:transcriptional regulator with GAF, ATPase, and Fis domain|nr:sigma 54-interacting transcriptional regulator [Thermoanaerobaculia bacterium]
MNIQVWCDYVGAQVADVRDLLSDLRERGLACYAAHGGSTGPGVIFFGRDSDELRERIRERSRGGSERVLAVALGRDPVVAGWDLLAAGATDVIRARDPAETVDAMVARFQRWEAVDRLMDAPVVRANLIGQNTAWQSLVRRVVDIAKFSTMPVLIHGESGTGKELIARLIHTLDAREDKQKLIVLDCTTIVPELSGSEFFGHERGAFTGAVAPRDGAFMLADGGTLFLDEVGELPPRLQAELLRVVQEGTYKRVGGNTWQKTRFRLVCATHREIEKDPRFRRDFYYRIAAWTCTLPPLRDRRDDIPALVRHFLRQHVDDDEVPAIDPAVLELLLSRDYPGNIRDLRHLVDRIAYRHAGSGPITLGDVPEEERPPAAGAQRAAWIAADLFERGARLSLLGGMGLKEISNAAADASVRLALDLEQGNVTRAAARLGITDRGLQKRRALWRQKGHVVR